MGGTRALRSDRKSQAQRRAGGTCGPAWANPGSLKRAREANGWLGAPFAWKAHGGGAWAASCSSSSGRARSEALFIPIQGWLLVAWADPGLQTRIRGSAELPTIVPDSVRTGGGAKVTGPILTAA